MLAIRMFMGYLLGTKCSLFSGIGVRYFLLTDTDHDLAFCRMILHNRIFFCYRLQRIFGGIQQQSSSVFAPTVSRIMSNHSPPVYCRYTGHGDSQDSRQLYICVGGRPAFILELIWLSPAKICREAGQDQFFRIRLETSILVIYFVFQSTFQKWQLQQQRPAEFCGGII
jgi:hypothetical protein